MLIGAGVLLDYGAYIGSYNHHFGPVGHRKILPGYCVGIGRHQLLKKWLDLSIRIQLEQKGQKTESFSPYDTSRYTVQRAIDREVLNYFTLSAMPRVLIGRSRKISIGIGGYAGVINRAKELYVSYHLTTPFPSGKYNVINLYNKYDAGAVVSFGYLVTNNENYSMSIQLTDNLGLINIIKLIPGRDPRKTNTVFMTFSCILHRNSATK